MVIFLKLISKYRKQIGILIAVLLLVVGTAASIWLYGHKKFNEGKADSDNTWTTKYNEAMAERNAKIKELNDESKSKADADEAKRKKTDKVLSDILAKVGSQTQVIEDINRKTLEVNKEKVYSDQDVIRLKLGTGFSDAWNDLNKKGQTK